MFFDTAAQIGRQLRDSQQTISVAESSTGGLISANLLSISGASAFFEGGSVVYTLASRRAFLELDKTKVKDLEPLTEAMVLEFAHAARQTLGTTWGIAELGAAGPSGSPYGHAAGTSVVGISGPLNRTVLIETGVDDRQNNMLAFTEAALQLLAKTLQESNNG